MQRHPVCAVAGILLAVPFVVAVLAQAPARGPVATETVYPRGVPRGQMTVVNVAAPRGLVAQGAEVSPADGVTVGGIRGEANSDAAIAWWEITLDVAKDAAPGDRSLVLVTKDGRTAPTRITIPPHVPAIADLKVAPQSSQVDVQMTATDAAADLGESPYVWFMAGCGSEPFVGVVRGTVSGGAVRVSLPDLHTTQPGSPAANGPCDLRIRVTDTAGVESNTLTTRVNYKPLTAPALSAAIPQTPADQEWTEFANPDDHFTIDFPGKPAVTETFWTSQFGAVLPAHIYSGRQGSGRYTVTVVDYNPIERLLSERGRTLPALDLAVHDYGIGYWKTDVRGAGVFAAQKFLQRDGKITSMLTNTADGVVGLQLQFVSNADQSRTFCSIYMHANHLVIAEATVPRGYPAPLIFQQSLGWLDVEGKRIRYQAMNYNEPDAPNRQYGGGGR